MLAFRINQEELCQVKHLLFLSSMLLLNKLDHFLILLQALPCLGFSLPKEESN
jgi:hypothetical protein